jgi:ABC-2 type transport system ATP-binding protein
MLTTILAPTSGTLELNGLNLVASKSQARRHFGVVFQEPSLDQDLTAWENMDLHGVLYGMPRKLSHERARMLLKSFELWDRKDSQVRQFSGGMKRRLEVARGLMHTPKILFLDEPTLGLDPQSRRQMWTHVSELNRSENVTIFLTTHYLDEADRVAARIAVMDHGRIIAMGSPQQLKEQTAKESLEEAFIALTGTTIRDEGPNRLNDMRMVARMWGR